MSDGALPTIPATRQAAAIPGRSRRGAVTGPMIAIDPTPPRPAVLYP
jgi:hypothetical protein